MVILNDAMFPDPTPKNILQKEENVEDAIDISSGLERAAKKREKELTPELGEKPYPEDVTPEDTAERAKQIAETREKFGGAEGLGAIRTLYSIGSDVVDGVVGLANIPLVFATGTTKVPDSKLFEEGLFTKKNKVFNKKRYIDYFNKEKDEGNIFTALAKTGYKIFEESPELKNEGEFVAGLINRASDYGNIISPREADSISNFWRPEASIQEQVIRSIPEFAAATRLVTKFTFRGGPKQIARATELLKQKYKNNPKMLKKINEKGLLAVDVDESLGLLLTDIGRKGIAEVTILKAPISRTLGLLGASGTALKTAGRGRAALGKRSLENIKQERARLQKIINKEKGVKDPRSLKEKFKAINKIKKDIAITEAGAILGTITAANLFAEEGEPGTLLAMGGAMVGGVTAGVGIQAGISLIKYGANVTSSMLFDIGNALPDELINVKNLENLVSKFDLSPEKTKNLKGLVFYLKSLPPDQYKRAMGELKYTTELNKKLIAAGVDEELVKTTIGKATNLVGVMHLQETLETFAKQSAIGAKSIDKTIKDIDDLMVGKKFATEYITSLRSVLNDLAGETKDFAETDKRYSNFISNLQKNVIMIDDELNEISVRFNERLRELMSVIDDPKFNPAKMGVSVDEVSRLRKAITEELIDSEIVTNPVTDVGKARLEQSIAVAGESAEELTKKRIEGAKTEINNLSGFNPYFEAGSGVINTDGALDDFVRLAEKVKEGRESTASTLFNAIKGRQVDVTKWFENLYSNQPYDASAGGTLIERIKRRIVGERDQVAIDVLATHLSRDTVLDFVKRNPNMFDEIKKAVGKKDFEIATFEDLRKATRILADVPKDKDITNLDIFSTIKVIATDAGINTSNLKLNIDSEDVMRITSNLNKQASKFYKRGDRITAGKYRAISDDLIEQLDPGDSAELRAAKDNYLVDVIIPYRNQKLNPLGAQLEQTVSGIYANNPQEWIKLDKFINGSAIEAEELIKQLKLTFGQYDSGLKEYVIDGKRKTTINNLLNNVLSYRLANLEQTKRVKGSILGAASKELLVGKQAREKAITGLDVIESEFLNRLRREGLLDLERVVTYNSLVTKTKEAKASFEIAEKGLTNVVNRQFATVAEEGKSRKDVIRSTLNFLPDKNITDPNKINENIFNTFVLSPGAVTRTPEIISRVVKNSGMSESEVKKQLGNSVVKHIIETTYGKPKEGADVGQITYDFDVNRFSAIVNMNEGALQAVLGDKFNPLKAVAEHLRTTNRNSKDYLREGGVNITTPGGLSLESLVSRAYSISRGVVSPRYVATEIALLKMRKTNVSMMKEILDDPKLVDDIIELIETNDIELLERITPRLLPLLAISLAEAGAIKKQEKVEKQVKELELEKFGIKKEKE